MFGQAPREDTFQKDHFLLHQKCDKYKGVNLYAEGGLDPFFTHLNSNIYPLK